MFGHRPDGKRVRDVDPIVQITPYLMPMRCDAQVFLNLKLDYEKIARYIVEQGQQGNKFTFMEIIIAAFVRVVSELPDVNRFVANKRLYARTQLTVSFALLKETADPNDIEENTVKCYFELTNKKGNFFEVFIISNCSFSPKSKGIIVEYGFDVNI